MITRIDVNGFKTLCDFALDFKPGLNILIGPNGAGKTNLVSFFEFLSELVESEASEATSRVGGAGAIFRRIGDNDYEAKIDAHIFGCVRVASNRSASQHRQSTLPTQFVRYEYSFSLLFPASRDAVLFSSQLLKISSATEFLTRDSPDYWAREWDLEVTHSIGEGGTHVVKATKFDQKYFDLPGSSSKRSKDDVKQLEAYITSVISSNMSLVAALPRLSYILYIVNRDLSAGHIYNIVPSEIKIPEDSASPPGIDRDGSGLAATLYALQRSKDASGHPGIFFYPGPRRPKEFSPSALDQLRSFLRIVHSSIDDFLVENDPFDNQLRVRFNICSGNYRATVPLALMSDGTLKWIALMTAALTTPSVFSIEEPENYLHPHMQGQLVVILRDILFREDEYRMTLMTTHSETLLNHCRPTELVIVELKDGCTIATRCKKSDEVTEEIRRTGFGLGYYYVANALHDM